VLQSTPQRFDAHGAHDQDASQPAPVQAYRFAAVSLKMTRMILRSHG
jgi:hypothetical protein